MVYPARAHRGGATLHRRLPCVFTSPWSSPRVFRSHGLSQFVVVSNQTYDSVKRRDNGQSGYFSTTERDWPTCRSQEVESRLEVIDSTVRATQILNHERRPGRAPGRTED